MRLQLFALLFLLMALTSGIAAGQEEQPITTTLELATDSGTVVVTIPEGWLTLMDSETRGIVANSADALDNTSDEHFAAGEVQIEIFTMRTDDMIDTVGLTEEDAVTAILEAALALPDTTGAETETPTLKTMDDVPVASAYTETPESARYTLVRMVSDETFLMLRTITSPNELSDWTSLTDEVLASVQRGQACGRVRMQNSDDDGEAPSVDDQVLTETYSDDKIAFTIDYPADWATRPSFPNGVAIGSSEEALDLWQPHDFASGDMHAFIGFGAAEEMFEVSFPRHMTPVEIFAAVMALEGEEDWSVSTIGVTAINELPAACLTFEQPTSATYILIIDYGDDAYLSASIQTAVDELDTGAAILLAMVESIEMKDQR